MSDLARVVRSALAEHGYLADEGLATVVFLALHMRRPLLLEGDAGVGKTEVAKVLARWTGGRAAAAPVLRGHRRGPGRSTSGTTPASSSTCGRPRRPGAVDACVERRRGRALRRALPRPAAGAGGPRARGGPPPVLLIDEVDRADDEFEALLLEVLSDWSVTVPELGTITAEVPPVVVITSNRTRDVHDALKRRCLYHWVEHPDFDREVAVIRLRVPEADEVLAREVAAATAQLRDLGLYKPPGRGRVDRLGHGPGRPRPAHRSTRPRSTPPSAPSSSTARTPSAARSFGIDALVDALRSRPPDADRPSWRSIRGPPDPIAGPGGRGRLAVALARALRAHGVPVALRSEVASPRPSPRSGPAGGTTCTGPGGPR